MKRSLHPFCIAVYYQTWISSTCCVHFYKKKYKQKDHTSESGSMKKEIINYQSESFSQTS